MSEKICIENVKIRRDYEKKLGDLKGYSESTVRAKVDEVARYDEFLNGKDFRRLNEEIAVKYKNHLKGLRRKGNLIKLKTINGKLISIIELYEWLRKQPGYRRRVKESAIPYFKLSKKERNSIASQVNLEEHPNLNQVITLVNSITRNEEVDKRDRALFSFILMTGIRVKSLSMLRLKDLDVDRLIITINPLEGVDAKFGKATKPVIVPLDDELLKHFLSWVDYLINVKGFSPESPLFPMTVVEQKEGSISFVALNVKDDFWKSTGAINKMFKDRSSAAGLPYFKPHSYRRALFQIFMGLNPTMEELCALSQNLGHNCLLTTILYYGQMDANKRSGILSKERIQELVSKSSENEDEKWKANMDNNVSEILKMMIKKEKESELKNKSNNIM